jgi:hypothetical protein
MQVVVTCREGLEDIADVKLAPNPAKEFSSLIFGTDPGSYMVTVSDLLGQTILRERASGTVYPIHLQQASAGLYFISVEMEDGSKKVLRLILEK